MYILNVIKSINNLNILINIEFANFLFYFQQIYKLCALFVNYFRKIFENHFFYICIHYFKYFQNFVFYFQKVYKLCVLFSKNIRKVANFIIYLQ